MVITATKVEIHMSFVGNFTSYPLIKLKSTTTPATGHAAIIKTAIFAVCVNGAMVKIPSTHKGKKIFLLKGIFLKK